MSSKNVVRLQAAAPLLVNIGSDERSRVYLKDFFKRASKVSW